jgi:RHS repeat-associated protein
MRRTSRRGVGLGRSALAMATIVAVVRTSTAAPEDVLRVSTPGVPGSASAFAAHPRAPVGAVSDRTGAFNYSHKIVVPPGRAGMEPDLALSYSSAAPLYGDIAAGWSLNLPTITRERGHLGDTAYPYAPSYRSSLAGGARLVPWTEPNWSGETYRAWGDTSFTRYRKVSATQWEAQSLDGMTQKFTRLAGSPTVAETFVLDEVVDRFGNRIDYVWDDDVTAGGLASHNLDYIDYTLNDGLSSPLRGPHARVEFEYEQPVICGGAVTPVGATIEPRDRTANYLRGERALQRIQTWVRDRTDSVNWRAVRSVNLVYETTACSSRRGGMRQLASIQESASSVDGVTTMMPAKRFTYGARGQLPHHSRPELVLPNRQGVIFSNLSNSAPPVQQVNWGNGGHDFAITWESLIDLDGDGDPDISNVPQTCSQAGGQRVCLPPQGCSREIKWNEGNGYQAGADLPLPSLWHGQFCHTDFQTRYPLFSTAPGSPHPPVAQGEQTSLYGYRYTDFDNDGLVDILAAVYAPINGWAGGTPDTPSVHPNCDPLVVNPPGVVCNGPGHSTPPIVATAMGRRESQTYNGRYIWRLHRGRGRWGFEQEPVFIESPIPLDSVGGESFNEAVHQYNERLYDLVDLDSDGFLDAVWTSGTSGTWSFWRGDGIGFRADSGGAPFSWHLPGSLPEHTSIRTMKLEPSPGVGEIRVSHAVSLLFDVNADGRLDLLLFRGALGTLAYLNTGDGFSTVGIQMLGAGIAPEQTALKPASTVDGYSIPVRSFQRRLVDIDGDGLPEDVRFTPSGDTWVGAGNVEIRWGAGPTFGALSSLIFNAAGAAGSAWSSRSWGLANPRRPVDNTVVTGDIIDIDGDGYPDLLGTAHHPVLGYADVTAALTRDPAAAPPALLVRIDSGRDSATTVTYVPKTQIACGQFQGCNARSYAPRHVVSTVSTTSAGRAAAEVTTYRFDNPVSKADERGQIAFRGFMSSRVTSSRNTTTISWFDYERDYRGLFDSSRTLLNGTSLVATSARGYVRKEIGPALPIYLPSESSTHTCRVRTGSEQEQATTCSASDARVRTVTTWSARGASGTNVPVWVPTTSTTTARNEDGTFARGKRVDSQHVLTSNLTQYWISQTEHTLVDLSASPPATVESVVTTVDSRGMPSEIRTWLRGTEYAVERRSYSSTTGLLQWEQSPEQYRLNPGQQVAIKTQYLPDSFELHTQTVVNALDHTVSTYRDNGTGAVTRVQGPQVWQDPECGSCQPRWAQTAMKIDGFGRTLEVRRSLDITENDDTYLVSQASFQDPAGQQAIVETANERRLDGVTPPVRSRFVIDGTGLVTSVVRRGSGAIPDETTTLEYSADGLLQTAWVPDPSTDGARVAYQMQYDGLGRNVATTRPDGSGATTSYYGTSSTEVEQGPGGVGDATAASRTYRRDGAGNLVAVLEHTDQGDHTTTYGHDVSGRVVLVTDADGVVTSLQHDGAGNRTNITRGTRSWSYGYDHDGNVVTVVAPHAANADPLAYTTSVVYDVIGRPTSRIQGSRDLTSAEVLAYGQGNASWTYDTGYAGIGKLATATVGTGGSGSLTRSYEYDTADNLRAEELSFSVWNGQFTGNRRIARTYDIDGKPSAIMHADGVSGRAATTTYVIYDGAGRPLSAHWTQPGPQQALIIAGLAWNRADRVVTRAALTADQQLTYDSLGRVSTNEVGRTEFIFPQGTRRVVVASQSQTYFGADDVKTLTTALEGVGGVTHRENWTFTYDREHQLKSATSEGYRGSYTYTAAGRMASVAVDRHAGLARNVTYQYDDDPDLVEALVQTDNPTNVVADLTWDSAGNQRTKLQGAATTTYRYDGGDDLREARTSGAAGGREIYWYDANGQRVLALSTDAGGTATKLKVWFGETEIDYGPTGAVVETRANVSLAGPMARIVNGSRVEYVFHNHLGHLLAATDESGFLKAGFTYSPFGELIRGEGTNQASFTRRFNDKETDALTGLSYYGARYYDPDTFTWTQADPLYRFAPDAAWAEPRRAGLYTFSLNNPLRYVDPNGLDVDEGTELQGSVRTPDGATEVFNDNGTTSVTFTDAGDAIPDDGLVALVEDGLGIVPRDWTRVSLETAQALDGLRILGAVVGPGAVSLLKSAAKKLLGPAVKQGAGAVKKVAGKIPNPFGSRGGPKHRDKIDKRIEELKALGHKHIGGGSEPEVVIRTPGGKKKTRRPDITTMDPDGKIHHENVGRSRRDKSPIARERQALDDIEAATGRRPVFTPYDR